MTAREKDRRRSRAYYKKHKRRLRAHAREYHAEHREQCNARSRRRYATHREERNAYNRAYRKRHPIKTRRYFSRLLKRQRQEALFQYGGKCQCCGESEPLFLTFDHVHRGHKKRIPKRYRSGNGLVRYARLKGYPSWLRVLCFNCNCGRERNGGKCPHKS